MTAQLSREDLREIAYQGSFNELERNLARMLLAGMGSETSFGDHMTLIEKGRLLMLERSRQTLLDYRADSVWYWQGDEDDQPESLSCPVIMSAETLRELLAKSAPPAPLRESLQHQASGNRPAVWVRIGDNNHAPDCTLDHDEAREWESRGLEVLRMVAPAPVAVPGHADCCPECGGKSLTWDVAVTKTSDVVQGRLRTSDVTGMFFLGCDECSETVSNVRMENIAVFLNACRAAMLKAGPVTAATWIAEAKKMAAIHGTSFVVFRNGEEPQCADPSKVVISFTDKGLGYPAAPEQEV